MSMAVWLTFRLGLWRWDGRSIEWSGCSTFCWESTLCRSCWDGHWCSSQLRGKSHEQWEKEANDRMMLTWKHSSLKTVISDMVYLHGKDFVEKRVDVVDEVLDAQSSSLWRMGRDWSFSTKSVSIGVESWISAGKCYRGCCFVEALNRIPWSHDNRSYIFLALA